MRVNPPFYRQVSGSLISWAQRVSVLIYIKHRRTHPLPTHTDPEISLAVVTYILMIIKRKHTGFFFNNYFFFFFVMQFCALALYRESPFELLIAFLSRRLPRWCVISDPTAMSLTNRVYTIRYTRIWYYWIWSHYTHDSIYFTLII